MDFLKDITITSIEQPLIIRSRKGDTYKMTDRACYGLSFCLSGQITYSMNGKNFVSSPDTAVLLPKGATYTILRDKEGAFPLINFECENCNANEITAIKLQNPTICIKNFEILQNMFLKNESRLKIMSAFYTVLDSVFDASIKVPPLLKSAESYIEKHVSVTELSNQSIAKHLNISEVYLRKLFNKYHKISPKQFLLEKRMQKAMYLLSNTAMNITAISSECGFSSVYHFSRAFKQRVGCTPTQYIAKSFIDFTTEKTE